MASLDLASLVSWQVTSAFPQYPLQLRLFNNERDIHRFSFNIYLPHYSSDKALKGTVGNQTFPYQSNKIKTNLEVYIFVFRRTLTGQGILEDVKSMLCQYYQVSWE